MNNALYRLSLDSILDEHARSYVHKMAVAGDDGMRFTYAELRSRVDRLANALDQRGVGSGDRVLWLGQNSLSILEGILACCRLGAIFCPLNWRQSAQEIAFVIDDFEPQICIWQRLEIGHVIYDAFSLATHRPQSIQHDDEGSEGYEAVLAASSDEPLARIVDVNDPVVAMYTAAFDGKPNAALLSQRAFLAQAQIVSSVSGFIDKTIFLNSGPLFHIGTMKFMLASFFSGGGNVFARRTDPESLCQLISHEGCTVSFLVTKTMQEMANLNHDGRYNLKSLVSESVSPEWDSMVTVINPPGHFNRAGGYGQTEVCGFALWQYYGGGIGNSGRPSPFTQARLLDDAGKEVADGEVGEFALRGPIVMNGYWRRPKLNAERHRDGWHRCNDLGRREIDGTYTFIGPKAHMIKSGVENIYPAEVESCLKRHPAVADCAVIGVPDPTWIQTLKAIVQLKPGMTATPQDLIEHCRNHIASYKKPRAVEFIAKLPRLPTFAVDYAALDQQFGGGGYPGGDTRSK